jgi:hypothetical protein
MATSSIQTFTGGPVNQADVERIAQATLRELGVVGAIVTVTSETQGEWRVDIRGGSGPERLRIRCGQGSTAQWVRQQIFDQYTAQG